MRGAAQTIGRRSLIQPTDAGFKFGKNPGGIDNGTATTIADTSGVRFETTPLAATYVGHVGESLVIESITLGLKPQNAVFMYNGNHTLRGCTIVCDVDMDLGVTSQRAQVLFGDIGSAVASPTFENNIVFGPNNTSSTFFIAANNASRMPDVMDGNLYIGEGRWYAAGTSYAGFAAYQAAVAPLEANSQHISKASADDLFVDWENGDFRIKDGQTVMTATANVVAYKDINGVDQPAAPQPGAYAYELAQTPDQYPAWGRTEPWAPGLSTTTAPAITAKPS